MWKKSRLIVLVLVLQLMFLPLVTAAQEGFTLKEMEMGELVELVNSPIEVSSMNNLVPADFPLVVNGGIAGSFTDQNGDYSLTFFNVFDFSESQMEVKFHYKTQQTSLNTYDFRIEIFKEELSHLSFNSEHRYRLNQNGTFGLNMKKEKANFLTQRYLYIKAGIVPVDSTVYTSSVTFKVENPFYDGMVEPNSYVLISNESTVTGTKEPTGEFTVEEEKEVNYSSNEQKVYKLDFTMPLTIPEAGNSSYNRSTATVSPSYKVGDMRSFWVSDRTTDVDYQIYARLAYSGTKGNVWVHSNEIKDSDAEKLGQEFDMNIHPSVTKHFGNESDVNADGKVDILCYDIQDGFNGSGGYIGGYFWSRDLYQGLTKSNKSEVFYIDTYPSMGMTLTKDVAKVYETVAHEFQHMINFNQNVLVEGGLSMPKWLNEGFSMAAEQIYSGKGLSGRVDYYNSSAAIQNGHSLLYWDENGDVLSNYSLSYLFGQYLKIQAGQGDSIFKEMMDDPNNDHLAVEKVAKKYINSNLTFGKLMRDFRAALVLKEPTGVWGFKGDPFFNSLWVKPFGGNSANLRGGGAIVVPFKASEGFKEPEEKGKNVTYTYFIHDGERYTVPVDSPTANPVTDRDLELTGGAEPGAIVIATVAGNEIGRGTADAAGSFRVTIPKQTAGTEIFLLAMNASGVQSASIKITVLDKTPPEAPMVHEVTDASTIITGSGESGSNIEVKSNDNLIGEGTVSAEGSFMVEIPIQQAGTKLSITARDQAGNVSEPEVIIVKDVTGPLSIEVDEVGDSDILITGVTEPKAKVTANAGGMLIGEATVNDFGTFEMGIITQHAGTVIELTATDYIGNKGVPVTITVVDKTAPVVEGVIEGEFYREDPIVVFNEGTAMLNGIPLENGSQVSEEGDYVLVVTDTAGNKTVVRFTIDKTPPAITGVEDHGYYNKDVAVSFNEGTGVLNGTVFASGTAVSQEGSYTLMVRDDAGNITTIRFVIDKTPPVVYGIEQNGTYNRAVTIDFNEGTATLNGMDLVAGTDVVKSGSYTLIVTDLAGNRTEVKFAIDTSAPVVIGVVHSGVYNHDVKIEFEGNALLNGVSISSGTVISEEGHYKLVVTNAAGNITILEFRVDKTPPVVEGVADGAVYKEPVTIDFVERKGTLNGIPFVSGARVEEEGKHLLVVTDEAGNETIISFTIDMTAPEISGVEEYGYYNHDVTVTFKDGKALLNGLAFTSGTTIGQEGEYTLEVKDEAGNTTTLLFTIDKTAPEVSGVKNGGFYNQSVTISFEAASGYRDDVLFETGEVFSDEGTYVIVVRDLAGNETALSFTIDYSAPVISGATDGAFYNKDISVSFNEGAARLNGTEISDGKQVSAEGVYTLVVTDQAGNESTVKFTIDKTVPKVTGVTNGTYYNKDVTVSYNEGKASLNGSFISSGRKISAAGVFTVIVTDLAGNKTTVKFTLDKTAPKITGVSHGKYYNKSVRLYFNEGKATLNGTATVSGKQVSAAGVYTLVATDQAGNKATVKFTIDKTAPKVTGVTNGKYYKKDVRVSFNEGKATLNGATFKSGTVVKKAKAYTLVVTDQASNKTIIKFTIDRKAPAAPKAASVKRTHKTITGTAEAYSKVTIKAGKKVIGSATADRRGKYKVAIKKQKKNTTLYITAKDRAGNTSKAKKTVVK